MGSEKFLKQPNVPSSPRAAWEPLPTSLLLKPFDQQVAVFQARVLGVRFTKVRSRCKTRLVLYRQTPESLIRSQS
jgi:hypothetical protein